MEDYGYKFYLEADIDPVAETIELRKEAAAVIELPDPKERQPDLAYFSSIFVSTGTNLNNAHFLASELVLAENTIVGKAVDIEHEEDQIIGHIYKCAFTDHSGNPLDTAMLKKLEIASLDEQDMHIEIASVVYKTRFPQIAKEIAEHKWKVSMEVYYQDFDILIGDTIITKDEAKALGFDIANEDMYGRVARLIKAGETVAEGKVARVLRGLCFSGVGIVKNPANPPSVVLEATASEDDDVDIIILDDSVQASSDTDDTENTDNKVTMSNIEDDVDSNEVDTAELQYNDTVGICVNYHKELDDSTVKDQDSKVIATDVCTKYDATCPTYGDATDPNCLRFVITASVEKIVDEFVKDAKIRELTDNLLDVLDKIKK